MYLTVYNICMYIVFSKYVIYICVWYYFFATILIPPVYGVNIIGFQQAVFNVTTVMEITVNNHILIKTYIGNIIYLKWKLEY